jgi:hypothetical protein
MKFPISFLFLWVVFFSFSQAQKPPAFVSKVYDDLYNNLYSTKQLSKPVLQYFHEDKQLIIDYIAASGGENGKIRVGSEFISVLRSFGPDSCNALAFVLGHELAHIFLEQSNIDRVGSGYADKELRKKLKEVKDSAYTCIFERQADEYAIFNAHLGGYKVMHIAEEVLTRIYSHFELKQNLKGYPTLEDRKKIARISSLKMSGLLERFEIANLAFVSGNYHLSAKIYDAILMEGFKSAEIYNNLGLCYLLELLNKKNISRKYDLPIFLDSKTGLTKKRLFRTLTCPSFAGDTSKIEVKKADPFVKEKLLEAIKNFDIAQRFNGYKWSYLNLAIAHFIFELSEEDQENDHLLECEYNLNKIKSLNLPHYATMSGIIAYHKGDTIRSKEEFQKNSDIFPYSKRNLDKLFPKKKQSRYSDLYALEQENPLEEIFNKNLQIDISDIFNFDSVISYDSVSRILPSFSNTKLLTKIVDGKEYKQFIDKRINDDKFYVAINFLHLEDIKESTLISFSDRIFHTNLYRYYIFQNWIIKYDKSDEKTIYLTQ